jgi:predicted 3-demethylubiquinone-9 3-methyltransferase (glyoxalase superfamily)
VTSLRAFLWLDDRAEEALEFYQGVFRDSEVVSLSRAPFPGLPREQLVMGTLRIHNLEITLFNGGPAHPFTDSISLFVHCEDQGEVDRCWDALTEGGQPGRCGWLTDRFGVSWQIVPRLLGELLSHPDTARAARVREAMLAMDKLDCAALRAAFDGAAGQMAGESPPSSATPTPVT